MRGLTLWQPWATLIAIGAKRIETRGWAPADLAGEIVITAAARRTADGDAAGLDPLIRAALVAVGEQSPRSWPLGCAVAVTSIARILTTDEVAGTLTPLERACGNYAPGRWAWALGPVRRLDPPVACLGARGLWPVDEALERTLQ